MTSGSLEGNVLPRLLLGVGDGQPARLESHLNLHGPLPDLRRYAPGQLIEQIDSAGLRGRGGASFPVARKLRSVASRRGRKALLANGAEGEPASKKDGVLLRELPHLVLDGIAVAARAADVDEAVLAVPETDERRIRSLERAIDERHRAGLRGEPRISLVLTPKRYIAGQEKALINFVNTGVAAPTFGARPFERGVDGRPTLVQNVETLAHLALIARHGARWFRQLGPTDDPGSALITVSGAVQAPGVYEIEHGTPLSDVLASAGADPGTRAVLVGGYFGGWIDARYVPRVLLERGTLSSFGTTLGAGVIAVLGESGCGVAETTRVADYFAAEGAGQCGPCVYGLAAIADTVQRLASGTAPARARADVERWCGELPQRGACAHPDGAVRFVASALRTFSDEFEDHAAHGPCQRCASTAVLPTPVWQPQAIAA
jgi:NADH:ubiquinone oxidoreductase subunit F (NADH-binding)